MACFYVEVCLYFQQNFQVRAKRTSAKCDCKNYKIFWAGRDLRDLNFRPSLAPGIWLQPFHALAKSLSLQMGKLRRKKVYKSCSFSLSTCWTGAILTLGFVLPFTVPDGLCAWFYFNPVSPCASMRVRRGVSTVLLLGRPSCCWSFLLDSPNFWYVP